MTERLARCIMVLGTTSDAGKSWVATGLCRYLSNLGLSVSPFKAQNMSNNARVVQAGAQGYGEIGSAQYFQALAARTTPCVEMNPVLLKPEGDCSSQLVVMGQVDHARSSLPWRERSRSVWPDVQAALERRRRAFDVVVIEGAGSPAEINLSTSDIVNLRIAHEADAQCLLVCDIDRGGAFAHLYGTWALLDEASRARLCGFVLNKFRGDPALLDPGPALLEDKTGVATVGVIPMIKDHGLPQEDLQSLSRVSSSASDRSTIAVIRYPRLSNFDEFAQLASIPGLCVRWVERAGQVGDADLVVLPGSKHTVADLQWLLATGIDADIVSYAKQGGQVLGVCAGMQMLGESLEGSEVQGQPTWHRGLGLLPVITQFQREKVVRPQCQQAGTLHGSFWSRLSGVKLSGYEIHTGRTKATQAQFVPSGAAIWQNATGNVLGTYLHGLLEQAAVLDALFDGAGRHLDASFERLAQAIARTQIPKALGFEPGR